MIEIQPVTTYVINLQDSPMQADLWEEMKPVRKMVCTCNGEIYSDQHTIACSLCLREYPVDHIEIYERGGSSK